MGIKKVKALKSPNGKATNGNGSVKANGSTNGNGHDDKELLFMEKTKSAKAKIKVKDLQIDPMDQLFGTLDKKHLLRVLTEVKNGNFTARMPIDNVGLSGKICDTLNDIIVLNEKMMQEFTRAGNTIGKQGRLTQRIAVPGSSGSWHTGIDSLNTLISDLVHPTIEIAHVISSVAKGNLSQQMSEKIGDHALQDRKSVV